MPKTPRLDLRRLERDAAAAGTRSDGLAPGGRPATGLMEIVRDNLDALVALQAGGQTWKSIAAGLTKQGFATADGRPLTDTHLTGIISSVRRQALRPAAKAAARETRGDLTGASVVRTTGRRLALSADLATPDIPHHTAPSDLAEGEETIRRGNLAKLQDLLKKD